MTADGQGPKRDRYGDEILYSASPTMFRHRPVTFVVCVLLIALFGLGAILLAAWWIQTQAHRLTVTARHVTYRTGIFSKRINEIRVADVRDINIFQDLIERFTNVGRIEIASAGSTARADFGLSGMPDPERVRFLIHRTPASGSTD